MRIRDWFNKADALEVIHKGTPVLSHPDIVSQQESEWEEENKEEEKGKQAHQALNDLFSSFEDEEEEE